MTTFTEWALETRGRLLGVIFSVVAVATALRVFTESSPTIFRLVFTVFALFCVVFLFRRAGTLTDSLSLGYLVCQCVLAGSTFGALLMSSSAFNVVFSAVFVALVGGVYRMVWLHREEVIAYSKVGVAQ